MESMESSDAVNYPESPMEEDEVFLCKGCGEILEQGRAFELAGHRWHLGCFRCHSCGTLLDSDANLLLLGDGSLICNNCTYSCSSCGNKIEDLAILTGDQAFCATCFKCRNCKRKIENLRYARTSQGIFCMSCHESLMARRRKKAKASKQAASGGSNPMVLDKSLPALPPNAVPQSALRDSSPSGSYVETPADLLKAGRESKRATSPMSDDGKKGASGGKKEQGSLSDMTVDTLTLTLPASTYRQERASTTSSMTMSTIDGDDGFLPMAYDPNPAPGPVPRRRENSQLSETTPKMSENKSPRLPFSKNNLSADRPSSSRSASTERDNTFSGHKPTSPSPSLPTQSQQARRNVSGSSTPASNSVVASPSSATSQQRPRPPLLNSASFTLVPPQPFKLQDVPHERKVSRNSIRVGERPSPSLDTQSQSRRTPSESNLSLSPASLDTPNSSINPFDDPKLREASSAGPTSARHPAREDSLPPSAQKAASEHTPSLQQPDTAHERKQSSQSAQFVDAPTHPNPESTLDSPLSLGMEIPIAPPRAASRPSGPSRSGHNVDFIAPRAPPHPPASDPTFSPKQQQWRTPLPKHSAGESFSMEEEMSRIMRGDETPRRRGEMNESGASVLRRVSNAVKHGRSFSDKSVPLQKTPTIGSADISSPILISSPISSPGQRDEIASLKVQLRRSQHRIAELEADKLGLEEKMDTSVDIKQVNTELREKRSTMAFLDTQREMVVRELEIMTEHLTKAKENNKPLDISSLKSEILQDFAHSMQKLKDSLGSQIEDLVHKRNELTDDITNLIQVKDKGLQEFESLSSKNSQLLDMNNQLVSSIQDIYKTHGSKNSQDRSPLTNGLGIYTGNSKADLASIASSSLQESSSLHDLLPHSVEAEPAHVLTAPQVVNIRKGQPKKFNWKKGSSGLAKNVTKGLKGAFAGNNDRVPLKPDGSYDITGMPYSQMQAGPGAIMGDQPMRQGLEPKGGFGFFSSGQKNGLKPGVQGVHGKNNSTTNLTAEIPSVLFGSDLCERCDFEKRVLPSIVTRCIEEVELRGIDTEGIYRKSGGSGQVKLIQQGFEKDGNYDISDPDLDIHAVTSALKQYFRKLPNPLITYDAYDGLLDAAQISDKEKQSAGMKVAIGTMPQAHKDVLEYLIQHLCRVVKMESENLMTPLNISVVFAPTILRPLSIEREMSDMQAQRMAVQALLEHADLIFDV